MVLGGRKLPVRRPRVRGVDGREVHLASYDTFAQVDLLAEHTVAAMLAGSVDPSVRHGAGTGGRRGRGAGMLDVTVGGVAPVPRRDRRPAGRLPRR